jgi:hypothetical protein
LNEDLTGVNLESAEVAGLNESSSSEDDSIDNSLKGTGIYNGVNEVDENQEDN